MERFFESDKNALCRQVGRVVTWAVELSHSLFTETYYLINDTQEATYNGHTFQPYPFNVIIPAQTEQDGTQIVLSNIQNLISSPISKIVTSNENIMIKLYCVSIETNVNEFDFKGEYEIISAVCTNDSVTGQITIRNCLDINIGKFRYNKTNFPNLQL